MEINELYNMDHNDVKTYELLSTGKSSGIFQLENLSLSGPLLRKIPPKNVEEIATLISIIRPGSLNSKFSDNKSATDHYKVRYLGEEENIPIIPELGDLLNSTYNIICFQEQAILIAKKLAGFDGPTAMRLQKGISKKKADVIAELRPKFIDGCVKNGVKQENAEYLYDMIEKSNRYSFVKAHACGYAHLSYLTAYMKANHTIEFFTASLRLAHDKLDPKEEIRKLVRECYDFGIGIKPPSLQHLYQEFDFENDTIWFGIQNIKGIGESRAKEFIEVAKECKDYNWYEILCSIRSLGKTVVQNCIKAGVFKHLKIPARKMLDDFNNLQLLTGKRELEVLETWKNYSNFTDLLTECLNKTTKKRKITVESLLKLLCVPPETLEDNLLDTVKLEEEMFGCAISYDNIDTIQTLGNCTIEEYKAGCKRNPYRIMAQIMKLKTCEVKTGKNKGRHMAFLTLKDQTGEMESVIFSEVYEEFGGLLKEGCVLMLEGNKGKTFIVNGIEQKAGF